MDKENAKKTIGVANIRRATMAGRPSLKPPNSVMKRGSNNAGRRLSVKFADTADIRLIYQAASRASRMSPSSSTNSSASPSSSSISPSKKQKTATAEEHEDMWFEMPQSDTSLDTPQKQQQPGDSDQTAVNPVVPLEPIQALQRSDEQDMSCCSIGGSDFARIAEIQEQIQEQQEDLDISKRQSTIIPNTPTLKQVIGFYEDDDEEEKQPQEQQQEEVEEIEEFESDKEDKDKKQAGDTMEITEIVQQQQQQRVMGAVEVLPVDSQAQRVSVAKITQSPMELTQQVKLPTPGRRSSSMNRMQICDADDMSMDLTHCCTVAATSSESGELADAEETDSSSPSLSPTEENVSNCSMSFTQCVVAKAVIAAKQEKESNITTSMSFEAQQQPTVNENPMPVATATATETISPSPFKSEEQSDMEAYAPEPTVLNSAAWIKAETERASRISMTVSNMNVSHPPTPPTTAAPEPPLAEPTITQFHMAATPSVTAILPRDTEEDESFDEDEQRPILEEQKVEEPIQQPAEQEPRVESAEAIVEQELIEEEQEEEEKMKIEAQTIQQEQKEEPQPIAEEQRVEEPKVKLTVGQVLEKIGNQVPAIQSNVARQMLSALFPREAPRTPGRSPAVPTTLERQIHSAGTKTVASVVSRACEGLQQDINELHTHFQSVGSGKSIIDESQIANAQQSYCSSVVSSIVPSESELVSRWLAPMSEHCANALKTRVIAMRQLLCKLRKELELTRSQRAETDSERSRLVTAIQEAEQPNFHQQQRKKANNQTMQQQPLSCTNSVQTAPAISNSPTIAECEHREVSDLLVCICNSCPNVHYWPRITMPSSHIIQVVYPNVDGMMTIDTSTLFATTNCSEASSNNDALASIRTAVQNFNERNMIENEIRNAARVFPMRKRTENAVEVVFSSPDLSRRVTVCLANSSNNSCWELKESKTWYGMSFDAANAMALLSSKQKQQQQSLLQVCNTLFELI